LCRRQLAQERQKRHVLEREKMQQEARLEELRGQFQVRRE
jgi:hypothetical protein